MRNFDGEAANWDSNPGRVWVAKSVAAAIEHAVPLQPDWRLLDYGCGTGLVTLALQPLVGEVVAADSSTGMLEALATKLEASALHKVTPRKLDLEHEEWDGEPFAVVVSSMTLHHIQHPELVVRRLAEALVDGGWLALADLDAGSEAFHADHTGITYHGFSAEQRQELFTQAGLGEIRTVEVVRIPREGQEFPVLLTIGTKQRAG